MPRDRLGVVELLHNLLESAAKQSSRAGLIDMLEIVADFFEADGVVIWRQAPYSDLTTEGLAGNFFAFADWQRKSGHYHAHNLPLDSATGRAVSSGRSDYIASVDAPSIYREDGYLSVAEIQTFTIHPFSFLDGKRGALNLYFERKRALTQDQYEEAAQVSKFFPELVAIFRAKSAHGVFGRISEVLHWQGALDRAAYISRLEESCRTLAEYLQAAEVSVFLADPEHRDQSYSLAATSWPSSLPYPRKHYEGSREEGLTGWVLHERKPLNLFDLAQFEAIQESLQTSHPGLVWGDSLRIRSGLKNMIEEGRAASIPLTFLAVPIRLGKRLFGVIRACTSLSSPYFFGDMEEELLTLIANELAQSWNGWTSRLSLFQENKSWEVLAAGLDNLSKVIEADVRQESFDEEEICLRALQIADSVINDHVISDVRRYDSEREELSFFVVHGDTWSEGGSAAEFDRLSRVFPTSGEPSSLGAKVIETRATQVIKNVNRTDQPYSPTFAVGRWMVSVPITVEDEPVGVLDLRGTGKRQYSSQAKPVAELLANQLGVYYYLAQTVKELRAQPLQLAQSYEDFYHQLKTPINLALARASSSVRTVLAVQSFDKRTERDLHAVRGLIGKGRAVSESLRLFALLAQGKEVPLKKQKLESEFIKILIELVSDAELLSDPDQKLTFQLNRHGFSDFRWPSLEVDRNLLLQCLINLLDNADKYSYEETKVILSGGVTKTKRFRFSVANQGIVLPGRDIENAKLRGWRAEEAEATQISGSGIGLWLVDEIMRAHGGELNIQATNSVGVTVVDLLFPYGS